MLSPTLYTIRNTDTALNNAVLQVVEVFRVVDDLDLVGLRAPDTGEPDVLLFDFLVGENLLHVHLDFAFLHDGRAVRTRAGTAREGPVVALRLGGFEDIFALVDIETAVVLRVEVGICGRLEEVVIVHRPAVVVEHFVSKVFYCGHPLGINRESC